MMGAPTGTVTFLFTDIEGSTRLWEQHPEAMRLALARHDADVRAAIDRHGGHVFKTVGDAFCAAFPTAIGACRAALAIQQALTDAIHPAIGPLRVRVALHTDAAEFRDGDYFGQPLNRVARLLAVGHGGQVLLSQTTADLATPTLDADARVRDLGEHRLRDLTRAEHVFQLLGPGSASDFPPLRSLDALPHNLPLQPTSFIGREREVAETRRLIGVSRLVTITGAGGVGKTRLALQVASEALPDFPDGVWLVELAPLADPNLVPNAVAATLRARHTTDQSVTTLLVEILQAKRTLLVLDNCEHLIAACASLADTLIRHCGRLHILATSREALGIGGEVTFRAPSLALPAGAIDLASAPTADIATTLSQYEAVRLFVDRAVAARPDFRVTNANAPAVAQICHRLDGIPLAIELAAARARLMAVEQIAVRLDDRFRLLTGGSRTALPRQQTLQAAIDWSYNLLDERERAVFRRLGVFAGGWTLEACEAVVADEAIDAYEALDSLTALVDKSLVLAEIRDGSTRYRCLETVRQYARERLATSGEAEPVWRRLQRHYLALAEQAEPELRGPGSRDWLHRLQADLENLRVAIDWQDPADPTGETAVRLDAALWQFWYVGGAPDEARERLRAALQRPAAAAPTAARGYLLMGLGLAAGLQSDEATCQSHLDEAMAIFRHLGNERGLTFALVWRGAWLQTQGRVIEARRYCAEGEAIARRLGDDWSRALALHEIGFALFRQGELTAGRQHADESLVVARQLGDPWLLSITLFGLGLIAIGSGDLDLARNSLEEGLKIFRASGDQFMIFQCEMGLGDVARAERDVPTAAAFYRQCLSVATELRLGAGIASARHNLGYIALADGDPTQAARHFTDSLQRFAALADWRGVAECLAGIAALAVAVGSAELAARLFGSVETQLAAIRAAIHASNQSDYDRSVAILRATLGDAATDQAWTAGRQLDREAALAEATAFTQRLETR